MKFQLLILSLAATLFTGLQPMQAAEGKVKCTEIIAKLQNDIASDPTRVLLAVEDALTTNDACSCEIIKTAITASKADNKLVGEIVATAIAASPTTASTIGECALTTAPGAAKEIKAAMQNALGQGDGVGDESKSTSSAGKGPVTSGKEPVTSGKEPIISGKEPITGKDIVTAPPATSEGDYGAPAPLNIVGIYLSIPSGGPAGTPKKETIVKVIRSCDCRPKKHHPHTGSSGATKS